MSITTEQLEAMIAAANARADQARDDALVEALSACKQVAETAREYILPQMVMGANKCHDDISDLRIHAHAILALRDKPAPTDFQKRVDDWIIDCFGEVIRMDGIERNHRFLEESLELVQSLGCTKTEAYLLVDYVFNRDAGEPAQEVGGAMNTLAALCTAHGLDMAACGETELARVWTKVESIRAKQAAKPKHSPLPQHTSDKPAPAVDNPIWSGEVCDGCGTSNTLAQIKGKNPKALSCCPERKMRPLTREDYDRLYNVAATCNGMLLSLDGNRRCGWDLNVPWYEDWVGKIRRAIAGGGDE